VQSIDPHFGEEGLHTLDPSGLQFELIAGDDEREPWTGNGVGRDAAIRGLHSVTTRVHQAGPSIDLLTGILGYRLVSRDGARTRVAAGGSNAGHFIDIVEDPNAATGINGLGTVHHVAMAISTADEQLRLREDLLKMGLRVTEVRDRCYFQSIYFREPGGVLYEVATIEPGFTVDEELSSLGRALKLPPWEEPFRAEIEAGLPDVNYL